MPFTHHSHSGQFCPGHARDSLEEVVLTAISKKLQVLAMTEHMPRADEDRYPEEVRVRGLAMDLLTIKQIEAGSDLVWLQKNELEYYREAVRLREKYNRQITILVGFEGEWIRPTSQALIEVSLASCDFDYFLGSVHHVHTFPIDYDTALYQKARNAAGGTDERLFEDYFDSQFALLQKLQPPVISHFDLIRLKSDDPERSFKPMTGVWQRILRNLDYVAAYDGVIELNFSSLRKGLSEPYPKAEICQVSHGRVLLQAGLIRG